MYKAAVIGDWDSIYGFSALGLDTFRVEAEDEDERAVELLKRLAQSHYEVIYITESLAKRVPAEIDREVAERKLRFLGVSFDHLTEDPQQAGHVRDIVHLVLFVRSLCAVCGFEYIGNLDAEPENFVCPVCGMQKKVFKLKA